MEKIDSKKVVRDVLGISLSFLAALFVFLLFPIKSIASFFCCLFLGELLFLSASLILNNLRMKNRKNNK